MALTALQKNNVLQAVFHRRAHPTNVLKGDVKAAIDSAAQWMDDNQASLNTAMPVVFGRESTTTQQRLMLMLALMEELN